MKKVALGVMLGALSGCASHLIVENEAKEIKPGIPVNSPQLVTVRTTTTFEVRPEYKNKKEEALCIPKESLGFKVLPLGERHYIGFDPAGFGKSEFSVSFSDAGMLTGVSLNSDPTEAVKQVTSLLSAALPYIVSPKPIPAAQVPAPTAKTLRDGTPALAADKERELYCLTKEVKEVIETP